MFELKFIRDISVWSSQPFDTEVYFALRNAISYYRPDEFMDISIVSAILPLF